MGQISSAFNDDPPRRIGNEAVLWLYGRARFEDDSGSLSSIPNSANSAATSRCLDGSSNVTEGTARCSRENHVVFFMDTITCLRKREQGELHSIVGFVPCEVSACDVMGWQPRMAASSNPDSLPKAGIKAHF